MSRDYEMEVTVSGDIDNLTEWEAEPVLKEEWPFTTFDWDTTNDDDESAIRFSGIGSIRLGDSVRSFVQRVSKRIWYLNEKYCRVAVKSTYLEELPYDDWLLTEDDYLRLIPDYLRGDDNDE